MSFLIDTDISSAHLKGNQRVFNRLLQHSGGIHLSVVSLSELLSWTLRASAPTKRGEALVDLLSAVTVLPVDEAIARRCGEIRASLLDRGRPIGTVDLLIAATALLYDFTLVTHNVTHFADVPGLRIEDWIA